MASESLLQPVRQLRTRLRVLTVLRGGALLLALVLALLLTVGAVDWLVHIDDHGSRLVLGVSVCALTAWFGWRWLVAPALIRLSDLQIARRIEAVCPQFGGRLASSVEFVTDQTDASGSAELKQLAITRAAERLQTVPVDRLVDRRPAGVALFLAISLSLLGGVLLWTRPVEATTAVRRLLFPFENHPWPRTTDLKVIDGEGRELSPRRRLTVVRGEFRELFVENTRGVLPDDSVLEFRVGREGQSRYEGLQPTGMEVASGGEVGLVTLAPARGPVYFRAAGGDHSTAWYRLDVVHPPQITGVRIAVTPPAYTGRPVSELPSGTTDIEVLVGSTVQIDATVSKPLQDARLQIGDNEYPVERTRSGKALSAVFPVEQPGVSPWWFNLTDTRGFANPRPPRAELRAIEDTEPEVYIDEPAADLQVTADAQVPLHVVARDDLGVATLTLEYQLADSGTEASTLPLPADFSDPVLVEARRTWSIGELNLSHGARVSVEAVATDAWAPEGPHVTRSAPRTLIVVSPQTKLAELAGSQARLLEELQRVADSEAEAADSISELQIQQAQAGRMRRTDLDLLKRVELDQHRIASALFDENDGLQTRAGELLEEFENNGLDAADIREQLAQMQSELQFVREQVLSGLVGQIATTRKRVEDALDESAGDAETDADTGRELDQIHQTQTTVLDTLEAILSESAEWREGVDLQQRLTELVGEQSTLTQQTAELAARGAGNTDARQQRQQAADAARLGQRQTRLADRLDQLLAELTDALENGGEDQGVSARLGRAASYAEETAPSARMREATDRLGQGHAGAAATIQADLTEDLQGLEEILRGRMAGQSEAQIRALRERERQLAALAQEQREIANRLGTGDIDQPDELRRTQQDVRRRTQRQRRRLAQAGAGSAAESAARGAEHMRGAESAMSEDDGETARRQAAEAQDDLQQAVNEARDHRRALEQQLARAKLARAVSELKAFVERQEHITEQTREQERIFVERGRRSRAQSRTILELAEQQETLESDVSELGAQLAAADVVVLVLEAAAARMQNASDLLRRRSTDAATEKEQLAARQGLVDIIDALQPQSAQADGPQQDQPGPQQDDPARRQDSGDLVPVLVRLKLLRGLQQTVNARTIDLGELQDQRELTPAELEQLDSLADQQDRIAVFAAQILEQARGTLQNRGEP